LLTLVFNATPTAEPSTLSLHDALPICPHTASAGALRPRRRHAAHAAVAFTGNARRDGGNDALAGELLHEQVPQARFHRVQRRPQDQKSTRLNSSHRTISYAVFCLKKKK